MKSLSSDRKLILITLALLAVEIIWLLANLRVIPNPFAHDTSAIKSKPAGYVLKSQRELRRRGFDSLIWEQAAPNETLYYYDSVLTLSQSSATLFLQEQTEIHLSENTLVTIEPQDSSTIGQIRLKFTRGDLRARNPYAQTKIETPEWTIDLNQGSEVSLKQTGDDNYEVEVLKGDLKFEKDSQIQNVSVNQVLKIDDNKVTETLSIEKELQLQGPEYQRIYSFNEAVNVPVTWKGQAEKIQITPLGSDSEIRTLTPGQTSENLNLEPGKYSVRLLSNGKVSSMKEIEIWKAPVVHLLSPFPRDRVKMNRDTAFVWSIVPEAKEYRFEITDTRTGQKVVEKSPENYMNYDLGTEGELTWRVIAIDSEGFEIPSLYSNPLFSQKELLAAPRLKTPEFRKPAGKNLEKTQDRKPAQKLEKIEQEQKTESKTEKKSKKDRKSKNGALYKLEILWNLLTAQAEAKDSKTAIASYEAIFAWEKVDGADSYTIEISKTPDFRKTEVVKKVKSTEFVWTKFPLGTYYWRVAGETKSGAMGEFSEPAKINLEKIPDKEFNNLEGVIVRPTFDPEKQRAEVSTKDADILANVPKPSFDESRFDQKVLLVSEIQRELKDTYLFAYTPTYYSWTLNGDDQLKAKFSDAQNSAGRFRTEQTVSAERSYLVDIYYAQTKWTADKAQFPFQDEITIVDARVQVLFGSSKYNVFTGAAVQLSPKVERKDNEEIEIKSVPTIGPSVLYVWRNEGRWSGDHQVSFLAGSETFMFSTQNMIKFDIYKGDSASAFTGVRFQGDAIFNKSNFSNGFGFGLVLGFENF